MTGAERLAWEGGLQRTCRWSGGEAGGASRRRDSEFWLLPHVPSIQAQGGAAWESGPAQDSSSPPPPGGSEGSLSPGLPGTQDGLRRARGKLLCPCLGGGSEQPQAPLVLPSRVLLSWLLWRERGDEHCCSGNTVLQLQRHQLLPRGKYCGRDSWAYQSRSNSGRALGVPVFPGIARESPPCSTGHGLPPQPLWAGLGWAGSTVCSQFPPRLGCSRLTQDPPCCSGLLSGWECSAGLWTRELIRTPKDVRSLPSSELVIPVPHPPTRVPGSISQTKGDFQPESSPTMLPCWPHLQRPLRILLWGPSS